MRRSFLLAAAALAVPMAIASPSSAQGRQDFGLVNRTGYQINEIYIGPSSSPHWGRDLLGRNVLADGRVFEVRFAESHPECAFDIKVIYDDGDTAEFMRVNLCRVSRVSLFWDRRNGTTRATVQ